MNQTVVAHAFKASTWEAEVVGLYEFKASLEYKVISSTFRTVTQKTLVTMSSILLIPSSVIASIHLVFKHPLFF